jgi:hypothetical protein
VPIIVPDQLISTASTIAFSISPLAVAASYWIEIAEGDDRRSALVQNVEPDALEGASTILRRLNFA